MAVPLSIVDAFTAVPFRGNPAAVCRLQTEPPAQWMQSVAAEMNLSETAFVWPAEEQGERVDYGLRWFTPVTEVDLCGHATLAAAHILWSVQPGAPDKLRFSTRSGVLSARRVSDWIELDFPRRDPMGVEPPEALIEALGVMPSFVGRSGESDYLVVIENEDVLRSLQPDFGLLAEVEARGVIVTAQATQTVTSPAERQQPTPSESSGELIWDFVSRFFAPASGIAEDPVTGSAHCTLGPYWARRLKRDRLVGYQASARGGLVRVKVDLERVLLGGQAVTVVNGELQASW